MSPCKEKIDIFILLPRLSLFDLFQCYWFTIQRRENELEPSAVFILSSYIFNQLKKEWVEKRGYSLEDFKYITSALDVLFDVFDPTPYVSDPDSNINKLVELKKT